MTKRGTGLRKAVVFLAACLLFLSSCPACAALDTFIEDFDSRADATIDGVEFWKVTSGAASNALVQSSTTFAGTGKALKITGAGTPPAVKRSTAYGNLNPTWIRFLMRAGTGGERRANPSAGIAAVSFDFSGRILAADAATWVDTGKTFTAGEWWSVAYKLNFTNHTYDLYLTPAQAPGVSFIPVKTGLNFIDSTKNSLSAVEFDGAYSAVEFDDDTYVDDFTVSYIEGIGFISPAQSFVAGQPSGPITVQLQNSQREPQKAPKDLFLELKSTSAAGKFSIQKEPWNDVAQILLLKDATSASFYYRDARAGKPILSAKEFPDSGWLEGLQEENVTGEISNFEVQTTSPQTAGLPFTVTILARTDEGVLDEAYNGTVTLTAEYVDPASGTMEIGPAQASGFGKGKLEVGALYPDAGSIRITAADQQEPEKKGSSGQILMLPASFKMEAEARQIVAKPFPFTVTALGASGAVTPNYKGTVNFGAEAAGGTPGAGSPTPASAGGESFQSGKAVLSLTYPNWGSVFLSGTDASSSAVSGKSEAIVFHPDAIRLAVPLPPPPRDFFYTGESFQVQARVLGADGVPIFSYQGTLGLEADSAFGLPETYAFTAEDAGVHFFPASIESAGAYQIRLVESAAALASETISVTVKQATLQVVPTVGPAGGGTEVTVLLVDENGQVIRQESSGTFNVRLVEDNPNQSTNFSALGRSIQLVQGRATFILADTEEENVTVIPESLFGAKVKPGMVKFGRFSKKGVGVLLWREVMEEKKKPHEP